MSEPGFENKKLSPGQGPENRTLNGDLGIGQFLDIYIRIAMNSDDFCPDRTEILLTDNQRADRRSRTKVLEKH